MILNVVYPFLWDDVWLDLVRDMPVQVQSGAESIILVSIRSCLHTGLYHHQQFPRGAAPEKLTNPGALSLKAYCASWIINDEKQHWYWRGKKSHPSRNCLNNCPSDPTMSSFVPFGCSSADVLEACWSFELQWRKTHYLLYNLLAWSYCKAEMSNHSHCFLHSLHLSLHTLSLGSSHWGEWLMCPVMQWWPVCIDGWIIMIHNTL